MNIYRPYFYIIQDTINKKYYIGIRISKNANPQELLTTNGYLTSSKEVRQLIETYGLNRFCIRKIRIFDTKEETVSYETRFLVRVSASKNSNFYNCHNNTLGSFGTKEYENMISKKYGVKNVSSLQEIKNKKEKKSIEKYGTTNPRQSEEISEKIRKTNNEKYGGNSPFCDKAVRDKFRQSNLDKYGHAWPMQRNEVKEKRKQTYLEKYGTDNPLKNEECAKKSLKTLKDNYGVTHNSQIKDVKKKKLLKETLRKMRPENDIIAKYCELYNIPKGNITQRTDFYTFTRLKELYEKYGPIPDQKEAASA